MCVAWRELSVGDGLAREVVCHNPSLVPLRLRRWIAGAVRQATDIADMRLRLSVCYERTVPLGGTKVTVRG